MSARPFDATQFVRDYRSGVAELTGAYGYNPAQELDSCGVGLVVALDGTGMAAIAARFAGALVLTILMINVVLNVLADLQRKWPFAHQPELKLP